MGAADVRACGAWMARTESHDVIYAAAGVLTRWCGDQVERSGQGGYASDSMLGGDESLGELRENLRSSCRTASSLALGAARERRQCGVPSCVCSLILLSPIQHS